MGKHSKAVNKHSEKGDIHTCKYMPIKVLRTGEFLSTVGAEDHIMGELGRYSGIAENVRQREAAQEIYHKYGSVWLTRGFMLERYGIYNALNPTVTVRRRSNPTLGRLRRCKILVQLDE